MRGSNSGEQGDEEQCGPCARGGGLLLAGLGTVLALIGLDLLTGGALTRAVTGGARGVGEAPGDNEDQADEDQADDQADEEGTADDGDHASD